MQRLAEMRAACGLSKHNQVFNESVNGQVYP